MNCLIFQSNFTSKQENNICSCSTVRKCLNLLRTIYCKPNFILLALGQNPEHHTKARTPPLNYTPQLVLMLGRQSWQRICCQIQLSKPCCQNQLTENNSWKRNVKKNRAWRAPQSKVPDNLSQHLPSPAQGFWNSAAGSWGPCQNRA